MAKFDIEEFAIKLAPKVFVGWCIVIGAIIVVSVLNVIFPNLFAFWE